MWRRARQPAEPVKLNAADELQKDELHGQLLGAADAAERHLRSIMRTMKGPEARLRELATAAEHTAQALHVCDDAGFTRGHAGYEIPVNWQMPMELRQGAPRPGPIAPWQALDRAFKSVIAALDDPAVPLAGLAEAWDGLAEAGRRLADAIDSADATERAVCSFCSKPARDVPKLIVERGVGICNECVDLCVEVLEQD